jgi:hypothetical protein
MENVIVLEDIEDIDDDGSIFRRPWTLPGDCGYLEQLLVETGVRFLTIDGLGYSVKGDSHNYANVGASLASLAKVAERTQCSILGLVHPPKGGSVDPVTAAIGSTAWTAIPRITWVLGRHPNDESGKTRVVRVAKTNYQEPEQGFSFTIVDNAQFECGVIAGLSPSDVTAEDLVAPPETGDERSERARGRDTVQELLRDGPMEVARFQKLTRDAGLSDATVRRARSDLKVASRQKRDPQGRSIGWEVSLPGVQPDAHISHFEHVEHLEHVAMNRENKKSLGGEAPPGAPGAPDEQRDLAFERLVTAFNGGSVCD